MGCIAAQHRRRSGPARHALDLGYRNQQDRATQTRIFEPDSRPKPSERGTGLGLSTVHGVVASDGVVCILVREEVGKGRPLKIYFPRPREGIGAPSAPQRTGQRRGTRASSAEDGHLTIRTLVRAILESAGYHRPSKQPTVSEALLMLRTARC